MSAPEEDLGPVQRQKVPQAWHPVAEAPCYAPNAGEILREAATTFAARNAQYRDNFRMIAPMVRALFPNGVPPELVASDGWHIFELILVKLARLAASDLTHIDSARDACVYSAMLESIIREKELRR
jgi:hypothetical protein